MNRVDVVKWRGESEGALIVALLCGVSMTTNMLIGLVIPLLPGLLQRLDPSFASVGALDALLVAAFPAAMLVGSPLATVVAAHHGRFTLLKMCLGLQAGATLLFAYAPALGNHLGPLSSGHERVAITTFAILVLARLGQGASSAGSSLAVFAIATDEFPRTLASVMGFNEVAIGLGFSIAPMFSAALSAAGGFAAPFVAVAGLILAMGPLAELSERRHRRQQQAWRWPRAEQGANVWQACADGRGGTAACRSSAPAEAEADAGQHAGAASHAIGSPGVGLLAAKEGAEQQSRCPSPRGVPAEGARCARATAPFAFAFAAFGLALATCVFGSTNAVLAVRLHAIGVPATRIGLAFAALSASYSMAAVAVGILSDSWTAKDEAARRAAALAPAALSAYQQAMGAGLLLSGVALICFAGGARALDGSGAQEPDRTPSAAGAEMGAESAAAEWRRDVLVLAMLGSGQALALVPSLPALRAAVMRPGTPRSSGAGARAPTTNEVVCTFNVAMQLGMAAGPLIGSALAAALGFARAQLCFGTLCLAYAAATLALRVLQPSGAQSGGVGAAAALLGGAAAIS